MKIVRPGTAESAARNSAAGSNPLESGRVQNNGAYTSISPRVAGLKGTQKPVYCALAYSNDLRIAGQVLKLRGLGCGGLF